MSCRQRRNACAIGSPHLGRLGLVLGLLFLPVQALAQANQPPVADAGPDLTVFIGQSAVLQGSASDPDGDPIVSWAWSLESAPVGSSTLLVPDTAPTPSLVGSLPGDYVVSLVVSDGIDFSLPDTVTVSMVVNLPPVAVASADVVSGVAPLTVTFDGTGSFDPEGAALDFDWRFGDPSLGATTPVVSHTYSFPGSFVATLEVVDDRGQIGSDFLVITVTAAPLCASQIDLTAGTTGRLTGGQSFSETRGVDVTVNAACGNLSVQSMTLKGLTLSASTTVGARIYDSNTTALIASASQTVAPGSNLSVMTPVFANLIVGGNYRVAFFVEGGTGALFDPDPAGSGGVPYTEATDALDINSSHSISADSFPSGPNFFVPQITLNLGPAPVPSLAPWGRVLLASLLLGATFFVARRRLVDRNSKWGWPRPALDGLDT